jgi:hypothetical protein
MENNNPGVTVLNVAQAEFIQGSVSIVAASCGSDGTTQLSKAFGCRVAADRRSVTIILSAPQAGALLADLRINRKLAVVFCRPTTDQTLQIKTFDAHIVALEREHYAVLNEHADKMVAEVGPLGFSEAIARPLFSCAAADAVAVRFTPSAVFDQTPGPNAGAQLIGES